MGLTQRNSESDIKIYQFLKTNYYRLCFGSSSAIKEA